MKTLPIIAPDKSVRLIPEDQAAQAVKAGGRIALLLNDHRGQGRWVPLDAVHSALLHGGGSFPQEQQEQEEAAAAPAQPGVDVKDAAEQIAQKWGGRVKL